MMLTLSLLAKYVIARAGPADGIYDNGLLC